MGGRRIIAAAGLELIWGEAHWWATDNSIPHLFLRGVRFVRFVRAAHGAHETTHAPQKYALERIHTILPVRFTKRTGETVSIRLFGRPGAAMAAPAN